MLKNKKHRSTTLAISKEQQNLISSLINNVKKLESEFGSGKKMKVKPKTKKNIKKYALLGYNVIKRGFKYSVRIRVNGKQEYISAYTLAELEALITTALERDGKGKIKSEKTNNKMFGRWWKEYLELYKKNHIKPSSFRSYESVYNNHLTKLELRPLLALSIYDVNEMLSDISGTRQRQKVYDMLNGCLEKAVELEFIEKNVCALLPRPKHTKQHFNALEDFDQAKFLNDIQTQNDNCKDFFKFLLLTGCRRGEALALTMGDVDFRKMQITINKTKSGNTVGTTKTPSSVRIIPIFKQLYDEVLIKYKDLSPDKPIFNLTNSIIEKTFYKTCRVNNIVGYSIHSFRHTFASKCFELGIPALQIQKWLGHKDVHTTQQIYIHLLNNTQQQFLNIANSSDFLNINVCEQNAHNTI